MTERGRPEIEEVTWSLDDLIGDDAKFKEEVDQATRRIEWHRRWGRTVTIAVILALVVAIVLTCWLIATGWLRLPAGMP